MNNSIRLPDSVTAQVRQFVFALADKVNYLGQGRVKNGQFMTHLVAHPLVGKVLEKHMSRERVKTYIKDAILNAYSKQRRHDARPSNIKSHLQRQFSEEFVVCDEEIDIELYKGIGKSIRHVVVAYGTYLKWETALRKALLYIPGKPFASHSSSIEILLVLNNDGKAIPSSDSNHLIGALALKGVSMILH